MGAYTVTGQRARQMRVVPAEVLKRLYARSDRHGLVQTAAHVALLVAGGWLVLLTKETWWVVPADKKYFRDLVVAQVVTETLERMDPKYPGPPDGLEELKRRLV